MLNWTSKTIQISELKEYEHNPRRIGKKGQSVYDPFGGSGTTLIACEKSDRNCYMMELSPAYVDIIINRWEKETGKEAILDEQ